MWNIFLAKRELSSNITNNYHAVDTYHRQYTRHCQWCTATRLRPECPSRWRGTSSSPWRRPPWSRCGSGRCRQSRTRPRCSWSRPRPKDNTVGTLYNVYRLSFEPLTFPAYFLALEVLKDLVVKVFHFRHSETMRNAQYDNFTFMLFMFYYIYFNIYFRYLLSSQVRKNCYTVTIKRCHIYLYVCERVHFLDCTGATHR